MDYSDPIAMIKKGVSDLIELRQDSYKSDLEFLARFEKSAAWGGDDWTYGDFLTAPKELEILETQSLSQRAVRTRLDTWLAKNEASKTALIREVETGTHDGMVERVRTLVRRGADPNGASLLKDTPLSFARYHQYDDVFDLLIELGADGEKAGFYKLHSAVRYGTPEDVERCVGSLDPLWSHFCARSALQEAAIAGKCESLSFLLDHIAGEGRLDDEEVHICFGVAVGTGDLERVHPFLRHGVKPDLGLDATLEIYNVEMLKLLLEHGADIRQISDIALYTREPMELLDTDGGPRLRAYVAAMFEAGWCLDDLDEFEDEQIRYFTEAYLIPEQDVLAPEFTKGAGNVRGNANPEERTLPFYLEMLRTGEWASQMQSRVPNLPDVIWTAHRLGQSTTRLADGRWVQIGGEHEDFYMREFVIFNDVVVHTPDKPPRVFFYPTSVFPPTDFHTATLIGATVWIIGGFGYAGSRQSGATPVYRLDLDDFSIQQVETTGDEPGWISRHSADETDGLITVSGGEISRQSVSENSDIFVFDTVTLEWTKQV